MLFLIGVIGSCIFLSKGVDFRLSEEKLLLNINARHAVVDWGYPAPNLQVNHYDIRFIKGKTDKNILLDLLNPKSKKSLNSDTRVAS